MSRLVAIGLELRVVLRARRVTMAKANAKTIVKAVTPSPGKKVSEEARFRSFFMGTEYVNVARGIRDYLSLLSACPAFRNALTAQAAVSFDFGVEWTRRAHAR